RAYYGFGYTVRFEARAKNRLKCAQLERVTERGCDEKCLTFTFGQAYVSLTADVVQCGWEVLDEAVQIMFRLQVSLDRIHNVAHQQVGSDVLLDHPPAYHLFDRGSGEAFGQRAPEEVNS